MYGASTILNRRQKPLTFPGQDMAFQDNRPPAASGEDDVDLEGLTTIQEIMRCHHEADEAKRDRLSKNRTNRDVYLGRMDWSYKTEGQSTEFIPKVPVSVEQMCSFIKRGLVQFGDWFSIDLDKRLDGVVDGSQIREVLKCFLADLWDRNNKSTQFPLVITDSVKMGLLESLVILKVHGGMKRTRKPRFAPGSRIGGTSDEMLWDEDSVWRLRIDLIRPEDYFPDPTGNSLYEIHECERDLHEVLQMAEDGIYDKAIVKKLIGTSHPQPLMDKRSDHDRNQPQTTDPSFRKKVLIHEFWGTLLNNDGTIAHENIVSTVANSRFLIRKPEPNPFWHQESPFVVAPLIRVPFSVWHKALYDHASDLNIAINELFSLMIDGGIATVHGVKQIRIEDLEDPGQVQNGVHQGQTLAVKTTLPHNADVMKVVATGAVPNDAMAMYEALNREYNTAVLSNEMKVGQLPPKRVLATEVVEVSQSQAVTLDGMVADIEISIIQQLLRKSWLNILQNADDIPDHAWTSSIDRRVAMLMLRASPEERYELFADKCQFKVFGLSATMQRALDFQKLMALLQGISQNPFLLQAYQAKYSADKTLRTLMRNLNLNPDNMAKDEAEKQNAPQEMQNMLALSQAMGGNQNQRSSNLGPSNPDGGPVAGGGSETPAQINQLQSPITGLPS